MCLSPFEVHLLPGGLIAVADRRDLPVCLTAVADRRDLPGGLTAVADRRDLPGGLIAVADRRDLPGGLTAVADLDCSGELCLIPVVSLKVLLCPPLAMGKYLYAVLKTSTWA